ncbi:MAG TPA: serine/threonine-protein kinase [Kofleriaceae bacterium]|nr:serine/threonine-protein kinase [Kofleriaceae bacterium]
MRCPEPRAFSDFVGGMLDDGARDALEVHVDQCASCRVTLSELGRAARREVEAPRLPAPGDVVGRYTIVGELGAGAMGVVYLARDPELDRELAIKVVQPRLGEPEHELVQQRMLREGRLLARIDHEHVVRVFDVGRWRGAVFVALARAPGVSLRAWLAAERRSAATIVDVFRQCAAGLAAAHAADVIHRDVKPDNVIVDDAGHARVTDFGLARATLDAPPVRAVGADDGASDPRLTRTRGTVGTPAYMAPEQHLGGAADGRSDQFALCVALAEALSGTRPFAGDDTASVVAAMKTDRPVLGSAIPRRVRAALRRGLAFDPARRWPSMAALADALAPRDATGWWVAGGAVVVAGAITTAMMFERAATVDRCRDVTAAIDATWNGQRQAELGTVFAASRQPAADAGWRYARGTIDRHVARWRTTRIEVCRAERDELATSKARCLERQRVGLDALLRRWAAGGADVIATAAEVVDRLPAPEDCTRLDERVAELTDERARAFEARLAEAEADAQVGRVREAVASLRALDAELADAPALRAKVLIELSADERDLGETEAAREHLVTAIASAERGGAERAKLLGWIQMAVLAGEDGVRLPEARDALRLAAAVIERLDEPPRVRSTYEIALGLVELRRGDHAAALAAIRRSLASSEELPIGERTRRRQILARAMIAAGDHAGALAELEGAERELAAALGPEAPGLVFVLSSMVEPLDYLGRQREAVARGERALAIFDASFGTANPRRARLLGNLASIYGNLGELDRAIPLIEEELAAVTRTEGADSHAAAIAHNNLASTLLDAKRPNDALPHLERAREIFIAKLGAQHPLLANVHSSLAHAQLLLGHMAEGVAEARQALAIREATKAGVGYIAFSRFVLAQALVEAGQRAEGIAMARHALEPVDDATLSTTGREGELVKDIRAFLAAQTKQR